MASFENNKGSDSISLNLTPMLDVFSILVTFLLMTYSTDPVSHSTREDIALPMSSTIAVLDEIPAVSVTKKELWLNDSKITDVIGGDVPETDRHQGAIMPLYKELVKIKEVNDRVLESLDPGSKNKKSKKGTLTMEMDSGHNFKLMKRIMLSGQQAEFLTFKLVVSKPVE